MSWRCAYLFCTEKHVPGSGNLSYHKFPLDNPSLLRKWLQAMGQPGFSPRRHHSLCSAHFESSDFRAGLQRPLLREGTVPSHFERCTGGRQDVPLPSGCARMVPHREYSAPSPSPDQPNVQIVLPAAQLQAFTGAQDSTAKHDHTYNHECPKDQVKQPEDSTAKHDHTYNQECPKVRVKQPEENLTTARKKIKVLHANTACYPKKSRALEDIIEQMREKNLLSEEAERKLQEFGNLPQDILKGCTENSAAGNSCGRRYSEEMKKFSSALYYYSPRAYDYLGTLFAMPIVQAIRQWLKVVSGWPGFTAEVLNDLKVQHAQDSPRERLCSIVLDRMSIRNACEPDATSGRLIGFVDLGCSQDPDDADNVPLATEALVFMAVGIAAPWKMPFGYFLNAGLSGEVLKNLLLEAIHCITECGLSVVAAVCDCLGANVSMAKLLGCHVHEQSYDDLKTFFPHPQNKHQKIFMIFDAYHGIKLLRNLLSDKGALVSSSYGTVQWRYIACLQELQDVDKLHAADELPRARINSYREVMKVKLAAQTFSSSVSKALKFASKLQLRDFADCSGTAKFIDLVDRAFQQLNSINPTAKGFKAPLWPSTFHHQVEVMEAAGTQLMDLRFADGRPVTEDGRRMSVISLAFTLKSVSQLAHMLFGAELCRYICTRNLTQEPLEMYFSCIRERSGCNNNPSAAQFRQAYQSTLAHAAVVGSKSSCVSTQLEGISLFRSQGQPFSPFTKDITHEFEEPTAALAQSILDRDYFALSEYSSKVVGYIGGFVVKAISRRLHCADCAGLLIPDTVSSLLRSIKDSGRLTEPSRFVHAAMHAAEMVLRQTTAMEKHSVHALALNAFQEFVQQHKPKLQACRHYTEDPCHVINLTRVLQKEYITLRHRQIVCHFAKENCGTYIRHMFSKRALFGQ
ncbi:hypothetical protein V5799_002784 [Amblyomma americanum]|uniref:THAP-type domain-containing protein n=1 Tax=Amblyomma americanum TaxID=6943 RepID=A0AAQ4DAU4_AMBAM